MSRLDGIVVIPRHFESDHRGWFLKINGGTETNLPDRMGDVYLTLARPGQVRGNHYHRRTSEWFTVIMGRAQLKLCDPATGETREVLLDAAQPLTIYVPAGIAHAFKNPDDATEAMLIVACANTFYDPNDTVPMQLL